MNPVTSGTLNVRVINMELLSVRNREPLKVYKSGKDMRKVVFKGEVVCRIA